jgi:2-haloacid dehalogenase
MTRVIAFDVNETLLDLRALDEPFEQLLGAPSQRGQWFAQMLQLSFVGGLTGQYVDFTTAQRAALQMLARRCGLEVSEEAVVEMVDRMSRLPPHEEVPAALARLRETSLTVVALTNSVQRVAEAQLRNGGIAASFDAVISADDVGALKPAATPYQAVAERYGAPIGEVRLVAAHSWDISGALAAGARAAFVARPGMVLSPLGAQPDIVGPDLTAVVERIVQHDTSNQGET